MKYRSRSDIVAAILEAARDGVIKTKIMYRAYLSFPQLNEYLSVLESGKLVQFDNETKQYRTTEKGLEFLKLHGKIGAMLPPVEVSA